MFLTSSGSSSVLVSSRLCDLLAPASSYVLKMLPSVAGVVITAFMFDPAPFWLCVVITAYMFDPAPLWLCGGNAA